MLLVQILLTSFTNSYNKTKVSWYGPGFNGRITANGETFNQEELTAASPNLPFNTIVEVKNTRNNKTVMVRINDRGPYKMDKCGKAIFPLTPHPSRGFDLSKRAFETISHLDTGIINVEYKIIR